MSDTARHLRPAATVRTPVKKSACHIPLITFSTRRSDKVALVMGEKELKSADLKHFCQAVSPNDEPCYSPVTVRCGRCGRWFCDTHVEDEEWHSCALPPGEEGGEA